MNLHDIIHKKIIYNIILNINYIFHNNIRKDILKNLLEHDTLVFISFLVVQNSNY